MNLTIAIPTDTEPRVLDALCGTAGHTPCGDQPACAEKQLGAMLTGKVTEYELFKARQAAAKNVPPLTLGPDVDAIGASPASRRRDERIADSIEGAPAAQPHRSCTTTSTSVKPTVWTNRKTRREASPDAAGNPHPRAPPQRGQPHGMATRRTIPHIHPKPPRLPTHRPHPRPPHLPHCGHHDPTGTTPSRPHPQPRSRRHQPPDNGQTLCLPCHKTKTGQSSSRRAHHNRRPREPHPFLTR